jgi:hypothetical protein
MITIYNNRSKRTLTKTNKDANIILNNKVYGHEWSVVKGTETKDVAETKERVSITETPKEVIKKNQKVKT